MVSALDRWSFRSWLHLTVAALAVATLLGAGQSRTVRADNWDSYSPGPLDLSGTWRVYPFYERGAFKNPPAIVADEGRPVLRLVTEGEAMRIGRSLSLDVRQTPWLVWEWKALVLPDGGDVRQRQRNDQAARVMLVFEGMKAVAYMWDSQAPVGTEVLPDELEMFQRALIVVRSGPTGLGQWSRQERDVYRDYRKAFGEEPRALKWLGLESHSNDTKTHTAALFGSVFFESR